MCRGVAELVDPLTLELDESDREAAAVAAAELAKPAAVSVREILECGVLFVLRAAF